MIDPKIAFAEKIKELQARLQPDNPDLILDSFILSTTSFRQIHWWDKLKTVEDFAKAHVLLQQDQPDEYVRKLFTLLVTRYSAEVRTGGKLRRSLEFPD